MPFAQRKQHHRIFRPNLSTPFTQIVLEGKSFAGLRNQLVISYSTRKEDLTVYFENISLITVVVTRDPTMGAGGQCPGAALLVKRRNSKWFFTNEPEVRFRFLILIKVGPYHTSGRDCPGLNVCPGVPSRLAKCPGISLQ